MNTKHIADIIKKQARAVEETQKAFKVAVEAINNALAKQRESLEELAEAFECQGLTPSGIRARASMKAGEKK